MEITLNGTYVMMYFYEVQRYIVVKLLYINKLCFGIDMVSV